MWTVNTDGRLAYVATSKHQRSALGAGQVPDVVDLMQGNKGNV